MFLSDDILAESVGWFPAMHTWVSTVPYANLLPHREQGD